MREKERKYFDNPKSEREEENNSLACVEEGRELAEYIHDHIIGGSQTFLTPFGRKKLLYCDHTASGQSLSFIEDFISQEVLPLYGNTHTTTSVTSLQTTLFRSDLPGLSIISESEFYFQARGSGHREEQL